MRSPACSSESRLKSRTLRCAKKPSAKLTADPANRLSEESGEAWTGRRRSSGTRTAPGERTAVASRRTAVTRKATPKVRVMVGSRLTGRSQGSCEDTGGDMDSHVLEAVDEARPDARGHRLAEEPAVGVHPGGVVEDEGVLEGDNVALHALDLRDVGDAAGPVPQAGDLHDEVHRGGDLLTDGAQGQVHAGHQDQRLQAGDGVARRVGVDRREGAVVAGVHGLEHVEGFAAADLADDN